MDVKVKCVLPESDQAYHKEHSPGSADKRSYKSCYKSYC
jgi:hypothetical protein